MLRILVPIAFIGTACLADDKATVGLCLVLAYLAFIELGD